MRRYPVITFCDRSEYFVENCDTYFTAVRDGFYKTKNILYDDYEFIFDGDIYKINKKRLCKRVVYTKSQVRQLGSDRAVISFEIVISFAAVCLLFLNPGYYDIHRQRNEIRLCEILTAYRGDRSL